MTGIKVNLGEIFSKTFEMRIEDGYPYDDSFFLDGKVIYADNMFFIVEASMATNAEVMESWIHIDECKRLFSDFNYTIPENILEPGLILLEQYSHELLSNGGWANIDEDDDELEINIELDVNL